MRLPFHLPLAWSILSSVALALSATPTAAAPGSHAKVAEDCRAEDQIELNLASWKASLKRAETSKRREEVLSEMKLSLNLDDSETSDGSDGPVLELTRPTLLGIEEHLFRLAATELPDHVIHVRYRLENSADKRTADLIQVLRPFGGPSWCILGADLSRQNDAQTTRETYTLGFVSLLDAKTKAIEVQWVKEQLRHTETVRQYWVADGLMLRKIFDEQIASMDNIDDGRDTVVKTGKLTLAGAFPKRIHLSQIIKHAICDAGTGDAPCDDNEKASAITFVYGGKTYARRK